MCHFDEYVQNLGFLIQSQNCNSKIKTVNHSVDTLITFTAGCASMAVKLEILNAI